MSIFSDLLQRFRSAPPGESLIADATGGAHWASKALTSSGYRADFSVESLRELDRFFDEQTSSVQARQGGLLGQHLGQRLFCLGAYCGEVIRCEAGGSWKSDAQGPQAEIDLALELSDGTLLWPVQRVMKRFQLGAEESLYVYGRSFMDA